MSFVIFAVFAVLIVILFRLFPTGRAMRRITKPLYELHMEHAAVHFQLGGVFFLGGGLAGFLVYFLVPFAGDYRLSLINDKLYTFKPGDGMASMAAVFFGLFFGSLALLFWGKRTMKHKWPEYLVYQSLQYKGFPPAVLKCYRSSVDKYRSIETDNHFSATK